MEEIKEVFFLKNENGEDLPDSHGVKIRTNSGKLWLVPANTRNRMYVAYQEWREADPDSNKAKPESLD